MRSISPYPLFFTLLITYACLTTVSSNNRPKAILESISTSVITPGLNKFSEKANSLHAASEQLCMLRTEATLSDAQESWKNTKSAWRELEPFYFGPHTAFPDRIGKLIDFWPVRENAIAELIESERSLEPTDFQNEGALVRGVAAIEYVAFGPNKDDLLDENKPRVCLVLSAMTQDLTNLAAELASSWLDLPNPYIASISDPSEGEFMSERGALSELVNRMGFTKTKDDTLKMKHGGRTCKGMRKAVRGGNFSRNG